MPTFYRGDDRSPEVIKRDGFDLWQNAKANLARDGGLNGYLRNLFPRYRNANDLVRWAVTEKSRERPTISTSMNEGCGGYDSGYIYKIEIGHITEVEMSKAIPLPLMPKGLSGLAFILDHGSVDVSEIVALDLKIETEEVVFFSKIAAQYITGYRSPKDKTYLPMSGVTAAEAAGPKKLKLPGIFANR